MKKYLCYSIWGKKNAESQNRRLQMWYDHSPVGGKRKCAEKIRKEMHPNVNTDYLVLAELWTVLILKYYFYFLHFLSQLLYL